MNKKLHQNLNNKVIHLIKRWKVVEKINQKKQLFMLIRMEDIILNILMSLFI